jgi:signal transduction histidine kinase
MTIRTKLALSISVLLSVAIAALGAGTLLISLSFDEREGRHRIAVIENSVQKAAQDALLQKDDLLLISYVKFLQVQYPALSFARVVWQTDGRMRELEVGSRPAGRPEERAIQVVHPGDSERRMSVRIGIDRDVLERQLYEDERRLAKIFLVLAGGILALGAAFVVWFAGTLTAPVAQLVKLAGDIGAGKLGGRLEWASDDELGQLVKVFNSMSQRLEDLDETKKNFVSSVTHELRSPLGAIESFLNLVQGKLQDRDDPDTRQSREYLGRIQVNVQRLGGFINDLLDVAKIEKGKMECVLKPMRLQEVAADVCQFFEAKAKSQGVALKQGLDGLPDVMGDPERLRQVLVNLIANGLKFTPSGGHVALGGEQYREGDHRWVEVSVTDTGRGMDPRDLSRLFSAFSQGRNVSEGVAGAKGTGLGLFITRSIVEQHGGKINVKSAPGKGTQIVFSLRLAS